MNKKQCRQVYKQQRQALTHQQVLKLDDLLLIQFQRLAFDEQVHTLLSYSPIPDRAEIDPDLFTKSLQLHLPDLQIAYPVILGDDFDMQATLLTEETIFINNKYNIPEPLIGTLIEPEALDVVFVPLLTFDRAGYRVGYGKGYYDRFLAKCRENVISIGFSYFDPVDKIDDANQFDIPLNYCITPQQLYEF